MINPFKLPGRFLRGNLHLHTTASDGDLSPQEAVDLYREHGYDFLAITDHGRLVPPSSLRAEGMTLLPGMELHPGQGEPAKLPCRHRHGDTHRGAPDAVAADRAGPHVPAVALSLPIPC